ncbi:ABC transporter substrate-binding protein [Kineococcus sp. NUM-3379]
MNSQSSTRRRRGLAVAAALTGATVLLTACGSSGSGQAPGNSGATLVAYTGQAGDWQANFNPFSPSEIQGRASIFEVLFFINKAQPGEPKPLLGESFAWNADGTELTVKTRSGVKWHDGQPFSAKDVAFTFNMIKENEALNNSGFDAEVTATDDTTVVFTWPTPAFTQGPDIISQTFIVPEHIWSKIADPAKDAIEKPIGTGAFKFGDFKAQAFTLVANEDYWGGAPAIKTIRFPALSGNQAGADAIAAGTIDWQTGPIPDIQNVSKNFPNYDKGTAAQNQMVLATCANPALGCKGPQTDPAVRQAIFYAIDRTQLNQLAFEKTASPISPSFALTDTQEEFISDAVEPKIAPDKADAAKSDQLLTGAGWTKGADGIYEKNGEKLKLTIEVVTGWTDYITAIQTISEQAKKAGIQLEGAQSSWNEWTDKRTKGNFQLAIDSLYQGPAADPYYVYNYFFVTAQTKPVGETSGNNYARYSNPQVDAAVDALKGLPLEAEAERKPHFDTIQTALYADMPYIPILTGGTTSIWNVKKFTGWPTDDNQYAFPAVWSRIDAAEIFKTLKPAGS